MHIGESVTKSLKLLLKFEEKTGKCILLEILNVNVHFFMEKHISFPIPRCLCVSTANDS